MHRHDAATVPVAVERSYELWIWLDAHVTSFPAAARAALGARVLDAALDLLDALSTAAWEARGSTSLPGLLRRANQRVGFLRLLLRGALERRHLSREQHAFAVTRLDAIGRMIGGWLKSNPTSAP